MLFVMLDYAFHFRRCVYRAYTNRIKFENALRGKCFPSRWFLVLFSLRKQNRKFKLEIIFRSQCIHIHIHTQHICLTKGEELIFDVVNPLHCESFGKFYRNRWKTFQYVAMSGASLMCSIQVLWMRRILHIEANGKCLFMR